MKIVLRNLFERSLLAISHRKQDEEVVINVAQPEDKRVESQQLIPEKQMLNQRYGWVCEYLDWTEKHFGIAMFPVGKNTKLIASFPPGSRHFDLAEQDIGRAEEAFVTDLLTDILQANVPGEVAEFGIFKGAWINRLYQMMTCVGLQREIWGFDSFKGLSKPSTMNDDPFWQESMFCADMDEVKRNIQMESRPNIRLIPGWFAESLQGTEVCNLNMVSFARIDCDLYEPTVDCLKFLESRLSHGAVLVFDDWSHDLRIGETRAFAEWVPTVQHLEFEFLFFSHWDHFYLRVWHVGKPRWPLTMISDRQ